MGREQGPVGVRLHIHRIGGRMSGGFGSVPIALVKVLRL